MARRACRKARNLGRIFGRRITAETMGEAQELLRMASRLALGIAYGEVTQTLFRI
jgi:hypothetical protein